MRLNMADKDPYDVLPTTQAKLPDDSKVDAREEIAKAVQDALDTVAQQREAEAKQKAQDKELSTFPFDKSKDKLVHEPGEILSAGIKSMPISYALSLLTHLLPVPIHVFDKDGNYLEKFDTGRDDNWNVLQTDENYRKTLIEKTREEKVTLFTSERPVIFGGVELEDGLVLILGPVVISQVDAQFAKLFALRHEAINSALAYCSPTKLSSMLLLMYSAVTGNKISLTSFLDRFFIHDSAIFMMGRQEADIIYDESLSLKPHNPISFEYDIIDAVKQGNVDALDRALNSPFASMRGVLAKDELRSQKNLAIVDITLTSRALIDTGFSAEEAFVMSDAFIRSVEFSKDVEEAKALARACAVRCTQLVARERNKQKSSINNPLVQQACDYIDRHAYAKFSAQEIADYLKVSVSHLCSVFKQEQRISMGDYMKKKKMELAAIMLVNTEQSLNEIALSLSFSSQSHFGHVFQQEMGCTPKTYRARAKLYSYNHAHSL